MYSTIKQLKEDNAVLIDALKEAELCLEDNSSTIIKILEKHANFEAFRKKWADDELSSDQKITKQLEEYNTALISVLKTAESCLKYQDAKTMHALSTIKIAKNK